MPRWVEAISHAIIQLAGAFLIVVAILVGGYVADRYTHAGALVRNGCQPAQGVWFCVAGIFGNSC